VDEEAGLRAGTATEIGARVGVVPASLAEEVFSPTWTAPGAFVPFKGENGSYVGYESVELDLAQAEIRSVKSKQRNVTRGSTENVLRSMKGFYQPCAWNW
jgi:hypothetical protein